MYEVSCLHECGFVAVAETRLTVGSLLMEHMSDAHDTPVDPREVGDLAIRRRGSSLTAV
jgi:hypothetical protein